jgi:transposase
MRPIGTADELERRRRRAVELMQRGESPTVIARILGIGRTSLYRWLCMAEQSPEALAAKPHPGPKPRLTDEQIEQLEGLLLQGATAHGWPNDLWTAGRVGQVIERHFGIEYHPAHVSRILRRYINWTCQRPQPQSVERDDEEIARWVGEVFPLILKAAAERDAYLVFVDEAGFMLEPTVRRTFAPCGKTPRIRIADPHGRISVIGGIAVSPDRKSVGFTHEMLEDNANYHGQTVARFLRSLRADLPGPWTLIWDKIPIHHGEPVRELIEEDELVSETFPLHAPELNPVDRVWGYVKYNRIPNFAPPDLGVLRSALTVEFDRVGTMPALLKSLIGSTGLPLAFCNPD